MSWTRSAKSFASARVMSQEGFLRITKPSLSRVCFHSAVLTRPEQLLRADGQAVLLHEGLQPLDRANLALPLGPLEDDGHVVEALCGGAEALPAHGLCPGPEEILVAGVVHLVDQVGSSWSAADLTEDHLPLRGQVPLHVREAGSHAERPKDPAPQLETAHELRLLKLSHGDDDRLIHSSVRAMSGRGRY